MSSRIETFSTFWRVIFQSKAGCAYAWPQCNSSTMSNEIKSAFALKAGIAIPF